MSSAAAVADLAVPRRRRTRPRVRLPHMRAIRETLNRAATSSVAARTASANSSAVAVSARRPPR
ncbi:hypothetical protein ACFPN0_32160 [Kitasatospora cinereorecta]